MQNFLIRGGKEIYFVNVFQSQKKKGGKEAFLNISASEIIEKNKNFRALIFEKNKFWALSGKKFKTPKVCNFKKIIGTKTLKKFQIIKFLN